MSKWILFQDKQIPFGLLEGKREERDAILQEMKGFSKLRMEPIVRETGNEYILRSGEGILKTDV